METTKLPGHDLDVVIDEDAANAWFLCGVVDTKLRARFWAAGAMSDSTLVTRIRVSAKPAPIAASSSSGLVWSVTDLECGGVAVPALHVPHGQTCAGYKALALLFTTTPNRQILANQCASFFGVNDRARTCAGEHNRSTPSTTTASWTYVVLTRHDLLDEIQVTGVGADTRTLTCRTNYIHLGAIVILLLWYRSNTRKAGSCSRLDKI